MRTRSAIYLGILLAVVVCVNWVPEFWPVALLQVGVFGLGTVWAVRMIRRPFAVRGSLLLIPFAGIVVLGLLQLLMRTTVYRWASWNYVLHSGAMLLLLLLSLQIFVDPYVRDNFRRAAFYFGFALAVVATCQLFTSDGKIFWYFVTKYETFLMGPFVYRNQYAAFVELLLPVALVMALRDQRRSLPYALMAAAMYASVIASASRAGTILVTCEILVVLALAPWRRIAPARAAGATAGKMALLLVAFTMVVGWEVAWNRLMQDDPFKYRREMTEATVEMVKARPGAGFGLGTWPTVFPQFANFDSGLFVNEAHNDWAQWAAEGGIPMLALMAFIAVWSIRPAFRTLWGIGVVSVFVHSFVDYLLDDIGVRALQVVLLGALAASAHRRRTPVSYSGELKADRDGETTVDEPVEEEPAE